jgi:hypothetical protein
MKILLGDFNANVGKEDITKQTIGNDSLYKISNDNGVATSKNLSQKCKVPTSSAFIHFRGDLLMERQNKIYIFQQIGDDIQVYLMSDRSECETDHYLVVAKVRERLAVSKQTTHRLHMENFNLKKLRDRGQREALR